MPDEVTNTDTTAQAATVEPGTQPVNVVKTFSQDEVNRLTAQARSEARERALKELVTKPVVAQSAKDDEHADRVTMKDLQAQIQELNLRNAFDKRVAKFDISDDASADLFQLYKAQKPDDSAQWFETKVKTFGLKPLTQSPTLQAASQEQTRVGAAAPSAPSKVDPITAGGLVDLASLTEAQILTLGPQGMRDKYEQLLNVGRQQSGAPPIPKAMQKK